MRTTLAIDDEVLAALRENASIQQMTVGELVTSIARERLFPQLPITEFRNGVPLLPVKPGAKSATLELIKELMDETQ